jgi:hypothetical protein
VRDKQEQLEWEARAGRLAALAALLTGGLLVASLVFSFSLPHSASDTKGYLVDIEAHKNGYMIATILATGATLAFIGPLLFLYEVTAYRRPEIPTVARVLAVAAPILVAAFGIWLQVKRGEAADQFSAGAVKTNKHAEDVYKDATGAASGVQFAAFIALGLSIVMISLNAMRAGVLSRFMGILGVILGVILVLPLIPAPVIQLFWVLALGGLFLGQWPGGRGPAWETAEPIPWPLPDRGRPVERDEADIVAEPEPEPETAATQNPRTPRKRKKRKAKR